jgi:hypothetical protein
MSENIRTGTDAEAKIKRVRRRIAKEREEKSE